jgi:hypothetical protein
MMAILLVGTLDGCQHPLVPQDIDRFEKAFDDSLAVWTTDLPPATVSKEYRFALQARGQPKPFRSQLISGQLPVGLQLDDDGEIHGTPIASDAARFIVRVACKWPPQSFALGSSPHIGWRMRQFTLLVQNGDGRKP